MLTLVERLVSEGIIRVGRRGVKADAEVALEGKASEVGGLVSGAREATEDGAGGGLAVGDEDGSALEVAVGAEDGAASPV